MDSSKQYARISVNMADVGSKRLPLILDSINGRVEQLFPKRGHILVTGFELSTRFPFGFFRHRRRLKTREVDIVVYPKPQPIPDELHLLPLFTGQRTSFRRGG